MKDTILTTASGLWMDLEHPSAEAVSLADIAQHLSRMARFSGATLIPYSVAEHALLVSKALDGKGPRLALLGLLHDAHEAYTGDIATPIQNAIAGLAGTGVVRTLQGRIDQAIWQAFNFFPTQIEQVELKAADRGALIHEWRFMPGTPPEGQALRIAWKPLVHAEKARAQFIIRFRQLSSLVPGVKEP